MPPSSEPCEPHDPYWPDDVNFAIKYLKRMQKTDKQVQCPDCKLHTLWEPK